MAYVHTCISKTFVSMHVCLSVCLYMYSHTKRVHEHISNTKQIFQKYMISFKKFSCLHPTQPYYQFGNLFVTQE